MRDREAFQNGLTRYIETRFTDLQIEFIEREAMFCGDVIGMKNGNRYFHVSILLTARGTVGCWTRDDFKNNIGLQIVI